MYHTMIALGRYWTYFVFVSAESMKTFSLVSASDRLRVRITLCRYILVNCSANTRLAVNSKSATIQFESGTISLSLYHIHYSDNYQHTHVYIVCMLIIIKWFHRNTCPSLPFYRTMVAAILFLVRIP